MKKGARVRKKKQENGLLSARRTGREREREKIKCTKTESSAAV